MGGEVEEEVVIVAEEGEEVEVDLVVVLNKDMMIEDMVKDEEEEEEEEEDQDQDMIQIIKRIYIVTRWKPNDFLQRNNDSVNYFFFFYTLFILYSKLLYFIVL